MALIYPVLMVGGAGTRLWPVSKQNMPKQFQNLLGDKSLFQDTVLRVSEKIGDIEFGAPIIIGAARYLELINEQLDAIGITPSAIVLEPCPRSTTPVAAIAAKLVRGMSNDGLALLLPSDHHIGEVEMFRDAIRRATPTAQMGWITTFGIAPTHAETGFGYIRAGDAIDASTYRVDNFFEKPDLETAQTYLQHTDFSWNAGIFLFSPEHMAKELETHAPDILASSLEALAKGPKADNVYTLDEDSFGACESLSIDYSVMERTERAAVLSPLACGWSDVGNWQAIAELKGNIEDDNIVAIDADSSFLQTDGTVLVAAVGIEDLIVVAHDNTVVVLPKTQAQRVQEIVAELKAQKRRDKL